MPEAAAPSNETALDLESLAADVVALAMKAGASDAEAVAREGDEFSVNVRMGEVETLKESGSRGLGLRVFLGKRSGSASTSDLTAEGIRQLVEGALALARVTEEDPFTGLPETARVRLDCRTICTSTTRMFTRWQGRSASSGRGGPRPRRWLPTRALPTPMAAALTPPPGARRWPTRAALWAATAPATRLWPRRRWPWMQTARCSATAGGRARGASRTSNRLKQLALKPAGAPCAGWARGALPRSGFPSFLRRRRRARSSAQSSRPLRATRSGAARRFLPENWASRSPRPSLTIVDDNTMLLPTGVGGFGTSPFDGEGLPSLRTVVVENGVLRNYLLNTYAARKLGMKSTHNASRGLAGAPGIGCGNLYLEPGQLTPEQIIADVTAGLYVTSLMGFGVNVVTGDYSRGATGLWIENGQLTHAVEEVTIAGNLAEMLRSVTAIGNDLVFRGSVAAPTLRIDGMTIAGK